MTPNLRRVLCALDVHRQSRSALALASVLAEQFDANLHGLYAAAPRTGWDNRLDRVKRLIVEHDARERLEAMLAPFGEAVAVDSFVTRGTAAEVIVSHAEAHEADLIVCGISGSARVGEGSRRLASRVASRATPAVLTVPGETPACALRRILLVVTEPDATDGALAWAETLAERFDASISLVRLARAPRFWPVFGSGLREQSSDTRRLATLQSAAARVLDAELDLGKPLAPERDADSIAALAEREGFDLILVGLPYASAGYQTVTPIVERLRRSASVPTLSVRAIGPTSDSFAQHAARFSNAFEPALVQSA